MERNQPVITDLHKFAGAETNQQLRKAVVAHPHELGRFRFTANDWE